jgi:hypothetical protein
MSCFTKTWLPQESFVYLLFPFSDDENVMRDELLEELTHYDESRTLTSRLFSIIGKIPLTSLFTLLPVHSGTVVYDSAVCIACRSVIEALLTYSQSHSQQDFRDLLYSICTNLGIQSEGVCAGAIDLNMVTLINTNICNSEECYLLDVALCIPLEVYKVSEDCTASIFMVEE